MVVKQPAQKELMHDESNILYFSYKDGAQYLSHWVLSNRERTSNSI